MKPSNSLASSLDASPLVSYYVRQIKCVEFIEHPLFTKQITELLSDDEYRDFQATLTADPKAGDVIPGLGGLRKIRVALPGRGKRGGGRVLYVAFIEAETLFLASVFTKGDVAKLPPEKRRVLRGIVDEIKQEFRQ